MNTRHQTLFVALFAWIAVVIAVVGVIISMLVPARAIALTSASGRVGRTSSHPAWKTFPCSLS